VLYLQKTVAAAMELTGRGLHTGRETRLVLRPAPPNTGLVFRVDDGDRKVEIPARVEHVPERIEGVRNTLLSRDGVTILTVEHILSALAGCGITSCWLDLEGPEPPEADQGGTAAVVERLRQTGIVDLGLPAAFFRVDVPVDLIHGDASLRVEPAPALRIDFSIAYDEPLIGTQQAGFVIDPETYRREIAPARTFVRQRDVAVLQQQGLARGGTLTNALVVDGDHLVNETGLHFPDEFVRHKILDLIGDLALLGVPLQGRIQAIRSGHASNVALVRRLAAQERRATRIYPSRQPTYWDIASIMKVMPHRYPFLLVDRILELESGRRVVGIKNVSINEPFFQGHFPGHPIMPAVLITEAMAQVGGVLLMSSVEHPETKLVYFSGIDGARFRRPVTDPLRAGTGQAPGAALQDARHRHRGRREGGRGEPDVDDRGSLTTGRKDLSAARSKPVPGIHPVRKPEIHPTAVIHPDARLGYNVKVGPYTIIGPDVEVGPECEIGSSVLIDGRTTIGRHNRIFHGAVIGSVPQDLKYEGETSYVEIGDDNIIREYVSIHLATGEGEKTRIGDGCLLMAYVHVAHNCHLQDHAILANAVNLAGHIEVGEWAIIGGMTPVHQFVRIGAHAFVGGGSRLAQDVPPFIRVAGNPVEVAGLNSVGLKRRGFDEQALLNLKQAYRILYRSGHNVTQALEKIALDCRLDAHIEELMAFIRRSERGIVR